MSTVLDLMLTTPTPLPRDERLGLVNVSEVRRLADGRVGAVVVTRDGERGYADYLFFVEGESGWLIDERVFLSETDVDAAPDS